MAATSETSRVAWAGRALKRMVRQATPGSDLLLAAVADQLSDAVFVVDPERNFLLFNTRAEEVTGFSRDEVLGRHCLSGIRCARCLESCGVFTKGAVHDVPLELSRKGGGRTDIVKSASVIRDREGSVLGAIEIFRRATPPESSRSCAEGEDGVLGGLDAAMEALGRGVARVDGDFVLRHVSAHLARLAGHAPSSLVGRPASVILDGDLGDEEGPFRRGIRRGERREGYRGAIRCADGSTVGASVSGAPLAVDPRCDGEAGRVAGYVLVVRPDGERPGLGERDGTVTYEGLVARSHAMRQIFQLVDLLGDSDATVLVTGESGTGKELVARAVHERSGRRGRPFVAVNCGALPSELLESELFGHARGAFTGAVRDKAGRFEVVEDGTIFLDEVGDLPLPLQVKLLRVLQERTFERLGETTSREVSARVVAATHQDLARLVSERRFREDLYYRLDVVPIHVPPLRERREDIEPLIFHLLDRIGRRRSRTFRVSPELLRSLLAMDWPGNVRQLENALEYATTVCEGETLHVRDLPPELLARKSPPAREPERFGEPRTPPPEAPPTVAASAPARAPGAYPSVADIERALEATHNRRDEAARLLGISRTTLWRRMRAHGMS